MPTVPRGPFNPFGRWIRAFSKFCQIRSTSALAEMAGVSDNVLTENMREDGPLPTRATVDRVWLALEDASQESPLRATLSISKELYYNIAGFGSPEQRERAELYLQVLEFFAEREDYIQQLEKEVEQLRAKRRPRTAADGR